MKHILTLLAFAWASTSLFAQNSTLTLYMTSTIPGSTEFTVSAVPMGTSDITIVDVVMVTDTDETVVVYALPDSISASPASSGAGGSDFNARVLHQRSQAKSTSSYDNHLAC